MQSRSIERPVYAGRYGRMGSPPQLSRRPAGTREPWARAFPANPVWQRWLGRADTADWENLGNASRRCSRHEPVVQGEAGFKCAVTVSSHVPANSKSGGRRTTGLGTAAIPSNVKNSMTVPRRILEW